MGVLRTRARAWPPSQGLLELHQIFLDMAVLVEAQGEMLDNIEKQVRVCVCVFCVCRRCEWAEKSRRRRRVNVQAPEDALTWT